MKRKICWLDINSSYSHSSLALPAIHAQQMEREDIEWSVVKGTIKSVVSSVVEELDRINPDIIAYTAWLFTHDIVLSVLRRYKTLRPDVVIIGGGPEYLGDNEQFLRRNFEVDFLLRGEGEASFYRWLDGDNSCDGLCYLDGDTYIDNGVAKVKDFASLRYPEESGFFDWSKPFIQIESARGCFNSCAFCVSGSDKPVRNLSIQSLRERLEVASLRGVKDIRVLDRTFNSVDRRTIDMLRLFREFAGRLRFHLEVHPALITEELKKELLTMPKDTLHLEAGVQSLSDKVIKSVTRYGLTKDVVEGLKFLASLDNMEVHSDLIAGLPHYTLDMLYNDVRTLAAIGCSEIQLELLKLLPGTPLRKNSALRYSPLPPYEVMQSDWITFRELQEARRLSRVIDLYYNCEVWRESFSELIAADSNFLREITAHLTAIELIDTPLSQERRGEILYNYTSEKYHDMLYLVAVGWLKAGLSLKKGAGALAIQCGVDDAPQELRVGGVSARVYCIELNGRQIWFCVDRAQSLTTPIDILY